MNDNGLVSLGVRFPPDLRDRFKRVCRNNGLGMNITLRQLVEEYCERQDALRAEQLRAELKELEKLQTSVGYGGCK